MFGHFEKKCHVLVMNFRQAVMRDLTRVKRKQTEKIISGKNDLILTFFVKNRDNVSIDKSQQFQLQLYIIFHITYFN